MACSALTISSTGVLGVSVLPETRDALSPSRPPARCQGNAFLALPLTHPWQRLGKNGNRRSVQRRTRERRKVRSSEPGHTVNNGRRGVKGNVTGGGNRILAGARTETERRHHETLAHAALFL